MANGFTPFGSLDVLAAPTARQAADFAAMDWLKENEVNPPPDYFRQWCIKNARRFGEKSIAKGQAALLEAINLHRELALAQKFKNQLQETPPPLSAICIYSSSLNFTSQMFSIQERKTYEVNITQKQKDCLLRNGFQEKDIKLLGRRQSSLLIQEAIKRTQAKNAQKKEAPGELVIPRIETRNARQNFGDNIKEKKTRRAGWIFLIVTGVAVLFLVVVLYLLYFQ